MATPKTLDDKHQKILRTLLQEPDNKKCFDCQNKGPVYVCLNFNTFVCTTCSGLHREFNHRVKSISMATFKPEEIKALQAGGNAVARKQWLARWTPDDFPEPDSSDQTRVRQFMKLKYHDKRWSADRVDPRDSGRDTRDSRDSGRDPRDNNRDPRDNRDSKPSYNTKDVTPPRKDSYPQPQPLEQILGKDIPPIQFGANGHTAAPPKPAAPVPKPAANALVDWETAKPASSSSIANDLNDLFTPSPEQQQQYQQQQQQYQQQQHQQAHQQQYLQQQNMVMAAFGQQPPWMQQQAFNPNAGMFAPPQQFPGGQAGWAAPPGQFNPNVFTPQPQQPGASFFTPTPQPQQPFGAPGGGYPGPQGSPQTFGQPLQPGYGTSPSPTFGAPPGSFAQQPNVPPQGRPQQQPQFGVPPQQQQQQQPPPQPAPPAKPDIFAALSPLNSGMKFGAQPTPTPNNAVKRPSGGSSTLTPMSSGGGLTPTLTPTSSGSSNITPLSNGSGLSPLNSGSGLSPLNSGGLSPLGSGGLQPSSNGMLGGSSAVNNPFDAFGSPTPQPQPQKQQPQQDLFMDGGFGAAPSVPQSNPQSHQPQQDLFGGGGFGNGFGAAPQPQKQQQQNQQPQQHDFFGGGGFGASSQPAPQPLKQQQQPQQHDFFGGFTSPSQPPPQQPSQQQQPQQQANPFGQPPQSAFSPYHNQQQNPFGGMPQQQQQQQSFSQATSANNDPFNPFAF